MNLLGAVLGIKVTLDGLTQVLSGVKSLGTQLGLTKLQISGVSTGFKMLAAEAAFMGVALAKAGSDETMRLTLEAVTHSSAVALDHMRLIRAESEKGLFAKSDIFEAVKRFDLAKQSIKDLLPLSEEFAARSGQSLSAVSKYISEIAGGGSARLQQFFKAAGITIDQLRGVGLQVSDHYQISNSPAQILSALKTIAGQNSITGAIGGGFEAVVGGLTASLTELWRSIGDGLLPVVKPLISWLTTLVQWITALNDFTHGLLSDLILLAIAIRAVSLILPIFRLGIIPTIAGIARLGTAADLAALALDRLAGAAAGKAAADAASGAGDAVGTAAKVGLGARIVAWFKGIMSDLFGIGSIGSSVKWIGRAVWTDFLAPVLSAAGLFIAGLFSGSLLSGLIASLFPGVESPFKAIKEHYDDYVSGDPDWQLQRGDARRHKPVPAEAPARRSDTENVMHRIRARSYA